MSFFNRLFDRKRTPDPQELLQTIIAFIQAPTRNVSRQVVEQHPELLTDEADKVLARQLQYNRANPGAMRALAQPRDLLRHCREEGVEAAFAKRPGSGGHGVEVPAEFRGAVLQITRLQQEVRRNPHLLGCH